MDELIFLGTLLALLVGGALLVKRLLDRQNGRQRNHPVFHDSQTRKPRHLPASQTLLQSHSTRRMHASGDIWRSARLKSGESHWETGAVVANKILTDKEWALEEREPEQGHGMGGVHYKPAGRSNSSGRPSNRSSASRRARR